MIIESDIQKILYARLDASEVFVKDFSAEHSGHNPLAKHGGTHINVCVVSSKFIGLSAIERHRLVFQALESELKSGLHALTIKTFTPEQWDALANSQSSSH